MKVEGYNLIDFPNRVEKVKRGFGMKVPKAAVQ